MTNFSSGDYYQMAGWLLARGLETDIPEFGKAAAMLMIAGKALFTGEWDE